VFSLFTCAGNSILNGTINGGNNGSGFGVRLLSGTHTVNSDCYGGVTAGSNAVQITTSIATFNGNIFGSTSSQSFGLYVTDTASNVVISTMTFSTTGGMPANGFFRFKNTTPTVTVRKANNTPGDDLRINSSSTFLYSPIVGIV
jgi:hypothetical protein